MTLIKTLTLVPLLVLVAAAPGLARVRAFHDIRDANGFTHSFQSAPSLHPPIIAMSGTDPDAKASGDIFTDAQNSIQAGPMIISPQGQLIWFEPLPHGGFAHDVAVQRYRSQSVLTYWQKNGATDVILDHHYERVKTVHAGNGYITGDHEFQITRRGTALITASATKPADLRSVGGPRNGTVIDTVIQEIDIATGRIVWQWDPDRHLSWNASYEDRPGNAPWDFTHMNSIQQLSNGNLLISVRNTWAVYEISKRSGNVLWELGGKHSSFRMGRGTRFEWQHDARMQRDGTITLFDDGSDGVHTSERQSRALRIRLDYRTHTATLVHAYTNRPPLLSVSQGNVQVLPDGNTFVDWGFKPYLTEFSKNGGRQLFSIHFRSPLQSYRGYRFQWWGQPTTPPSAAASSKGAGTTVYASWNGATTVASWRVLAGPSAATLAPVEQFPDNGFETTMHVSSTGPYFAVQALDVRGRLLAISNPVKSRP
jgi:arylsulfotransferase ASST